MVPTRTLLERFEVTRCLDNWKEDSSGSEQSRNEVDDDSLAETKSVSSNVHFTLGGDPMEDDISPMLVLPRKTHRNSMSRSQSHDINITATKMGDREREISLSAQTKLSQSDSNLEGPGIITKFTQPKKLQRDQYSESDDYRSLRRIDEYPRKTSEGKLPVRRMGKDQPEEDPKVVYIKNFKDGRDMIDEERMSSYRQSKDATEEFRRRADSREGPGFRRVALKEGSNDLRKIGGGEEGRRISLEDCRKGDKMKMEELLKTGSTASDEKEESHSTDSNSTAADDSEAQKKKKLKLFGNFRKNKSKLS
ncbi:hypothetical protein RUM44_008080 [Polyplax serrata]|uniref:Uncharacterized protein n=1 Tax=Polyplax serrata TaxID=468196 RepID=A0ABR1B7M7_POLSC